MNPDLLNRVGQALYGPIWKSALARDVNVAVRTMQRWAAGETPIPPKLREELARLAAYHRKVLGDLYSDLKAEARTFDEAKEPHRISIDDANHYASYYAEVGDKERAEFWRITAEMRKLNKK